MNLSRFSLGGSQDLSRESRPRRRDAATRVSSFLALRWADRPPRAAGDQLSLFVLMAGSSCLAGLRPWTRRPRPLALTHFEAKTESQGDKARAQGRREGGNHWRQPPAAGAARLWPRRMGPRASGPHLQQVGPERPARRQMRQTLGRTTPYLGEPRRGARER